MTDFDELQKEFWDENTNLRAYDHPIVHAFAQQRIAFIRKLVGIVPLDSCLEVGCGDGFGIYYMQELTRQIYGCDISLTMLKKNPIEKRYLSQADIYSLPYAEKSFDLVYCWEVLHHVQEPLKAIREIIRVGRRYVLIFEPNSFNLPMAVFGLLVPSEIGLLRFTPWYLKTTLSRLGVEDVQTFTVGCFTPNRTPMWLFKLLARLPYRWPLVGISNMAFCRLDG